MGQAVTRPVTEVGIVFQDPLLLAWRSVLKNVLLQVEVRKLGAAEEYDARARDLLKRVGLAGFEESLPRELSGGMKQRVSICRALVHDPPLLLMDEPFGALDAMTRDQMKLDLQNIMQLQSKSIAFVTHSITEAVFLADRVAVMSPRPGEIQEIVEIDIDRPRRLEIEETRKFNEIVGYIRRLFEEMGIFSDHLTELPDSSGG
jgi:NitT/TauT family transport system ATP-binding protein